MVKSASKLALGATLFTVSENVAVLVAVPLLAVIVTVWLCAGPSVVAYDQFHVPLLVPDWVIVPTEAVMVTLLA